MFFVFFLQVLVLATTNESSCDSIFVPEMKIQSELRPVLLLFSSCLLYLLSSVIQGMQMYQLVQQERFVQQMERH